MNKTTPQLNIKKLGVIANPTAGAGGAFIENVASSAISKFRDSHIIRPRLGEGREATVATVKDIASSVDAILVVGGDGTMSVLHTASLKQAQPYSFWVSGQAALMPDLS